MLKANEKIFEESLDQLNICDSILRNEYDNLIDVQKKLAEQSSLDEEIMRLNRISFDMEQLEHNMKSMIKILRFAELQYSSCEKNIINFSEDIRSMENGRYRLKPIKMDVLYAEKIDWKKG